jgi:hypothetical protein
MGEISAPTFDPRITPARPDLAAMHLAGKVEAARFAEGQTCEVVEPQAPVRRTPSPEASLDTEALKGERLCRLHAQRGAVQNRPSTNP